MKCPLTFEMFSYPAGEVVAQSGDCLKEECAWWDEFSDRCALWAIGRAVNLHGVWLEKLVDKMPHVEHF